MLGRIRAGQGQSDVAATLLGRAVTAAGDTDYLPAYYQAQLLLRGEGQHSPIVTPETARAALALLKRVTTLAPNLADAHGLTAYASLTANEPKAAMDAAAIAFKLSPRHEYALVHARARVFMRDSATRPALMALAERGSSDWVRREARELLDFLATLERVGAPGATPSAAGPPASRGAGGSSVVTGPPKVVPVFRPINPGEVREIGVFEAVECRRDAVIFTVKLPARLARVSAKAFDQVEFFTYRSESPGQVPCGPQPKPERVYLTYRADGGTPGSDGVVVAIELLPDDFQP